MVSVSVLIAGSIVGLLVLWQKFFAASRFPNLPPGPKPGLFGNKIPNLYSWRHFHEWTKVYGPVFTVWLGNKPLFVVGKYEAAMDLLERRGAAVTADRPTSIAAGETMSGNMRILLVKYGETWRRLRRCLHTHLQPKSAKTYEPKQEVAARNLVLDILEAGDDFQGHAKRYAATVVVNLAYGKQTKTSYTDPEIVQVMKCQDKLADYARPGAYKVESFPILKHFPGYLDEAKKWHGIERNLFEGQMKNVQKQMETNSVEECFGTFILNSLNEYQINFSEASYLAGSLFGAGSETTASAISISIMAAALYPGAQDFLHQQLDKVLEQKRPPQFSDMQDLPRVSAWVNEVLRWRSVSSGGFLHALTEDLVYNDYVLPKGSYIVGNHWGIHADADVFPNPDKFEPSRWLTTDENGMESIRKDLRTFAFGFGRRVCPGQHIALRSLHITISNILWTFKITKAIDPKTQQEIEIDSLAFTNRANSHPLPFKVQFQERFPGAIKIFKELEDEAH